MLNILSISAVPEPQETEPETERDETEPEEPVTEGLYLYQFRLSADFLLHNEDLFPMMTHIG